MATVHAHPRVQTPTRDVDYSSATEASPTLTNPDMILPYRDTYASPAPIASSPTLEAFNTSLRKNGTLFQLSDEPPRVRMATAIALPASMQGPPVPLSMPYRSYEHGAPLSSIGEEESTIASTTGSGSPVHDNRTSPTKKRGSIQNLEKRWSDTSDLSLSGGSDTGRWEDFDSGPPMSEKLKADLDADADDAASLDGLENKQSGGLLSADDDMKRAEEILANAKKRLTKMEDNLSKARTSIIVSPRSSPIMGEHQPAGGLYRSISLGGDRRLNQGGYLRKSKPLYPVLRAATTNHSRGNSETSIPSSSIPFSRTPELRSASALDYNAGQSSESMLVHRPLSFVKSHSPSSISPRSFTTPLKVLQEEDSTPSTNKTSPDSNTPRGLGIVTDSPPIRRRSVSGGAANIIEQDADHVRSTSQSSYRSIQLRDQMQGLKSKIADLKARAQTDHLRRRSLQNMRVPSPFNSAPEQWYATAIEYKTGSSPLNTDAGLGWSPQAKPGETLGGGNVTRFPIPNETGTPLSGPVAGTGSNTPNFSNATTPVPGQTRARGSPTSYLHDADPLDDESADVEEPVAESEEEQVYLNEVLEESLQEAEPGLSSLSDDGIVVAAETERHEDRVDAFDYENMFLHSALGNYSQPVLHRRNRSIGSDDENDDSSDGSGETAKAAVDEDGEGHPGRRKDEAEAGEGEAEDDDTTEYGEIPTPTRPAGQWAHVRTNSSLSVATTATFATATEGYESGDDAEEETPSQILNWGNSNTTNPTPGPLVTSISNFPSQTSASLILGMQARASAERPAGEERDDSHRTSVGAALPTPTPLTSPASPNRQSLPSAQFPPGVQGKQQQTQPQANAEVLITSLITLADPEFHPSLSGFGKEAAVAGTAGSVTRFADVDKDLILSLMKSVGTVLGGILKNEANGEVYERRGWRRRLDAAKRVLDGEVEVVDEEEEEEEAVLMI